MQPSLLSGTVPLQLEEEVRTKWAAGEMPGWEDRGLGQVAGTSSIGLDLQAFDTPEELESIGEQLPWGMGRGDWGMGPTGRGLGQVAGIKSIGLDLQAFNMP